MIRIILDIIIALSVISGWWFVALPLAAIATWRLNFFIEIIMAGIAYDAIFGPPASGAAGHGLWAYAGTLTAICVVILVYILKKIVR